MNEITITLEAYNQLFKASAEMEILKKYIKTTHIYDAAECKSTIIVLKALLGEDAE